MTAKKQAGAALLRQRLRLTRVRTMERNRTPKGHRMGPVAFELPLVSVVAA
jgi:hypothetical protein